MVILGRALERINLRSIGNELANIGRTGQIHGVVGVGLIMRDRGLLRPHRGLGHWSRLEPEIAGNLIQKSPVLDVTHSFALPSLVWSTE